MKLPADRLYNTDFWVPGLLLNGFAQIRLSSVYSVDLRIIIAFCLLAVVATIVLVYLWSRNKKLRNRLRSAREAKADLHQQIEKLKHTNQQKKRVPGLSDSFFAETNSAVILTDRSGQILETNQAFTRLYGYTREEYMQSISANYLHSFAHLPSVHDAIEKKKSISFPIQRTTKNGNSIWVHCELCTLNAGGHYAGHLLFSETDIEVYKSAEFEMIQQNQQIVFEKTRVELQRNTMVNKLKNFDDSIRYALRIQNAIMPSKRQFDTLFRDYFIYYQPRDVVSGDFYWLYQKGDKILIAVADCTGHGVPGAFMSILGMNYLNELCTVSRSLHPEKILNQLREMVIDALHYDANSEITYDGMDISILVLDTKKNSYEFAGAYHSLYFIKEKQLEILQGDKAPVGYHPAKEKPFTLKKGRFEPGTHIYMFTDGYIDQFGWRNGKKFKSYQFKQLLLDIQDIPINGQKVILENTINNWKGDLEQLDDILVVGIKIQ